MKGPKENQANEVSFEKEYQRIMKYVPASAPEWSGKGDGFVKFSLYKHAPTIATPNLNYSKIKG